MQQPVLPADATAWQKAIFFRNTRAEQRRNAEDDSEWEVLGCPDDEGEWWT